jgi:A/G-specific adenine glycosylase
MEAGFFTLSNLLRCSEFDFRVLYHRTILKRQPGLPSMPLSSLLLDWYDRSHRLMPWRLNPDKIASGEKPDPYRVWLSEIMLQQTTVATVGSYFEKFTALWPTVRDLAAASEEDVLRAWAGLGYYSRARNLKKCADLVVSEHGGTFPDSVVALQKLPGVGPYTAAAIASIAFAKPLPVVDGNVERVVARLKEIAVPPSLAKAEISNIVASWVPGGCPGDFAQAMMDLGATICTPRNPSCLICPLVSLCLAHAHGRASEFPVKITKNAKPRRVGAAFILVNDANQVLLTKRGPSGLLAGMSQVPTTSWSARADGATGIEAAPLLADWQHCGSVRHIFTHFELVLVLYTARAALPPPKDHWWSASVDDEALPTLMKKVISTALLFHGERDDEDRSHRF